MEEILKKINSDLLTESVVSELKDTFDSLVSEKVEEFKKAELIAESEKLLDMYDAKFEEFKVELNESKEAEMSEYKNEIVEALDSYLDLVVAEFIAENTIAIEDEVQAEKQKAIVEAFDAILVTAGVDVARIVEAKGEEDVELSESLTTKISEMEARLDKVISENKALADKNEELLKLGLVAELTEGLSVVQKERFNKLSGLVEMGTDKVAYLNKLESIKESVVGDKVDTKVVVESSDTKVITESVVEVKKIDSSRFF